MSESMATVGVFVTSYLTLMCAFFGTISLAYPLDVAGTTLAKAKGIALLAAALVFGLIFFYLTAEIYKQ